MLEAYSQQFKNDFSCLLESRSQEMVYGGRMVLSFLGRQSMDHTSSNCYYQWELLAHALMTMVLEVHNYNIYNIMDPLLLFFSILPLKHVYYKI